MALKILQRGEKKGQSCKNVCFLQFVVAWLSVLVIAWVTPHRRCFTNDLVQLRRGSAEEPVCEPTRVLEVAVLATAVEPWLLCLPGSAFKPQTPVSPLGQQRMCSICLNSNLKSWMWIVTVPV